MKRVHRHLRDTPVEANRTLTAFSAVFGYADRLELVPPHFNPCRHVERYREAGRRRALTVEELQALGRAIHEAEADGANPAGILALRLLALTGFRRSELLGHTMRDRRSEREGLRWGDADLDVGVVRLRDTKTGAQTRVIGRAVVDLLAGVKPDGAHDDDPVCPGSRPGRPFVGIDKLRVRIYQAAGLGGIPGVDLHSLRHTFASLGAHVANGRHAVFVGPLLGHGYPCARWCCRRMPSGSFGGCVPMTEAPCEMPSTCTLQRRTPPRRPAGDAGRARAEREGWTSLEEL